MLQMKTDSFMLDEITSIEEVGIINTFDFTVDETHCFFANEILVHNCLEEVCDKAFMLHWEWFYDNDVEDKYEYIIRLSKNRTGLTGTFKARFIPEYSKVTEVGVINEHYRLSKEVRRNAR